MSNWFNESLHIGKWTLTPASKKVLLFLALTLGVVIIVYYWIYSKRYVSTDDAYMNANVVQMATRVTGQVSHLSVVNNQYVKKGQLLLELDPKPFITNLEKAKAQLAAAQANLQVTKLSTDRKLKLVKDKVLPAQSGDDALASLQSANANMQLAEANLTQANLDLLYTKLIAPTNGWITNLTLREGNNVQANQPLFALISDEEFWVDANYKETQLGQVHKGQSARIEVDMYPQHDFKGVVESISGGSGTAFSLLPPQNATGNWVKVTQRIPVRVKVLNPNPQYPLRIGTTATVTIDTHSGTHS